MSDEDLGDEEDAAEGADTEAAGVVVEVEVVDADGMARVAPSMVRLGLMCRRSRGAEDVASQKAIQPAVSFKA